MSKNLVIGAKTYEGVSTVNFNTSDNGIAIFKDVDEMASGSFDIPTELTLAGTNNTDADMLLSEFVSQNNIICNKDGMIILKFVGDTPVTNTPSYRTIIVWFNNGVAISGNRTGSNNATPPSETPDSPIGSFNTAYFTAYSNVFAVNGSFKAYVPAGGSIYYAVYPISYNTGLPIE